MHRLEDARVALPEAKGAVVAQPSPDRRTPPSAGFCPFDSPTPHPAAVRLQSSGRCLRAGLSWTKPRSRVSALRASIHIAFRGAVAPSAREGRVFGLPA